MIRQGTFAVAIALSSVAVSQGANATDTAGNAGPRAYDAMIARHAAANGVPEALVRRVIMRESRYNPRAVSKGNYGMMQIRLGTARAMGYQGSAAGLLDPDVNMTYAVRYLAGAYRVAGGNHDRAVMNYARGYYYQAKAQGFSPYAKPSTFTIASASADSAASAVSSESRDAFAFSGQTRKSRRAARQEAAAISLPQVDSRYDTYEPAAN